MVGLLNLSQFMENARHPLLHVPKGRTEMDKRPKRHFWLQRLQKLRSEFFKRTLCKCEKKGPFFFFLQGKHQLVIRLPQKALGQDLEKKRTSGSSERCRKAFILSVFNFICGVMDYHIEKKVSEASKETKTIIEFLLLEFSTYC